MMYMPNADRKRRIAVVGGGAAGLMAAGTALENGANVTIFEPNRHLGRKLAITGKGRCNLTNDCTASEILENVTRNARFLYAAMTACPPSAVMSLVEGLGVPLKTERGRRVFPVSDRAADIVDAFSRYAQGAEVRREKVLSLCTEDGRVTAVKTKEGEIPFDAVILATGGVSYPLTGSDGSGHAIARALGHTVTPLSPSLVPLTSSDPICAEMMGLSLKNVALRILKKDGGKPLYEDFGEMLFTHFGLSGPMVLSASAHLGGADVRTLLAQIDLKPALDEKMLDARLRGDFEKYANRDFCNALGDLLPAKMIAPFVRRTGIPSDKKVHSVTKEERRRLLWELKHFSVPLSGFRPIEEAIITRGGIAVKEVDPRSMMSKLVRGLYFAGEILDVDAYTGGYNLQIAFATGAAAGKHAAKQEEEDQ